MEVGKLGGPLKQGGEREKGKERKKEGKIGSAVKWGGKVNDRDI